MSVVKKKVILPTDNSEIDVQTDMQQQIIYRVADLAFEIQTPDAGRTRKLLDTFAPFEVQDADSLIFTFTGGAELVAPDTAPSEVVTEPYFPDRVYNVWTQPNGFLVELKDGDSHFLMEADRSWRHVRSTFSMTDMAEFSHLGGFIRTAYCMAALPHRAYRIHASVTELNGNALLFLGPSGTGKSTHSRLWREYVKGCSLLNDDEPIVRLSEDCKQAWIYGSPWSGKTPCYRNIRANIVAMVFLFQHPENILRKADALESVDFMMKSCSALRSDPESKQILFNLMLDTLSVVPMYRLDCRPDREAVSLTETLMPQ